MRLFIYMKKIFLFEKSQRKKKHFFKSLVSFYEEFFYGPLNNN
jgi:hypothetical protein